MASRTQVIGIDFSGSQSPGRDIWLTLGTVREAGRLEIDSIRPAAMVFDANGREEILGALRSFILDHSTARIGLDFPFGLPAETVDADTWLEFLQSFQSAFQGKNISAFPGEFGVEETSKRETDYRFAGQSPFSPQIKYQVFYGIRDVLAPLVLNEEVSVWPLHQLTGTSPTLLEVYPAATFGRLCCYRTGYKGGERAEHRRRCNLDTLERSFNFGLEDPTTVIDSDDALDSLAAACAAASAKQIDWPDDAGVEGRICP